MNIVIKVSDDTKKKMIDYSAKQKEYLLLTEEKLDTWESKMQEVDLAFHFEE